MKKSIKLFAMLVLLVSTVFVFNAMPGLAADQSETQPTVTGVEDRVIFFSHPPMLVSDVHQQAYLTYLVMDYLPESIDQWKEAFAERKQVMAKMPKPVAGVKSIIKIKGDIAEEAGKLEIFTSGIPAVKAHSFDIQQIEEPAVSGGENRIFMKKGVLDMPQPDEKTAEKIKTAAELEAKFESAVESGNAEAIKEVLPQLLEDYKKVTAEMAEFVEKNNMDQ